MSTSLLITTLISLSLFLLLTIIFGWLFLTTMQWWLTPTNCFKDEVRPRFKTILKHNYNSFKKSWK
jgi:hypothetical protein